MCIGDTDNCPYLTPHEQRAQHNFEERKGPLPETVRSKVVTAGLMTEAEYLEKSIRLRGWNSISGLHYGDCRPEESAYIAGNSHTLPERDQYLPAGQWEKLVVAMQERRQDRFLYVLNHGSMPIAWLREFPEFSDWIVEAFTKLSTKALAKVIPTMSELFGRAGAPEFPRELGSYFSDDQLRLIARHRTRFFFQFRWALSGTTFDSIYEEEMRLLRTLLSDDEKERIRMLASESAAAQILPEIRGRGDKRRHLRGIHRCREKLLKLQAQIPKRHFDELAHLVFRGLKEGPVTLSIAA